MEIIYSIIRSFISYILLLICARMMGRKLIAQMTFFDFAVAITLGTIAASLALGTKYTPVSAAVVALSFTLLSLITSIIYIKGIKIRKIINSEPVVVVANGVMLRDNLKKVRININDLNMKLREKNIFNIADVEFAIMETDGEISVLQKGEKQPLTPSDINNKKPDTGLCRDIILDGELMSENLLSAGKDEEWLKGELKKCGVKGTDEVFYAALDSNSNLYVSKKSETNSTKKRYGIE